MTWFFLALLAGFVWGLSNTIDKFVLSTQKFPPILVFCIAASVGLVFSVAWFASGKSQAIAPRLAALSILAGVLYGIQFLLAMNAIKKTEVSRVVPIFYFTPAFVLLLSVFFLGESLALVQTLGVFLITAGAVIISINPDLGLHWVRSSWLMLTAALVYAVFAVITKFVVAEIDYGTAFAYIRIGVFIAAIPPLLLHYPSLKHLLPGHMTTVAIVAANETINLGGMLAFTVAVALGSVTLVNALASTSPFFVLALTILATRFAPGVLHEDISKKVVAVKLTAICLMFTGAFLVT